MEYKELHVNDIDKIIDDIKIIDIRDDEEFAEGSLKNAKHIPMIKILDYPEQYLKKDEKYYILCHSGRRSAILCYELIEKGFDLVNLRGGIIAYEGENIV